MNQLAKLGHVNKPLRKFHRIFRVQYFSLFKVGVAMTKTWNTRDLNEKNTVTVARKTLSQIFYSGCIIVNSNWYHFQ